VGIPECGNETSGFIKGGVLIRRVTNSFVTRTLCSLELVSTVMLLSRKQETEKGKPLSEDWAGSLRFEIQFLVRLETCFFITHHFPDN